MKLLLKGGKIVSGEKVQVADVLVQGEKILAVGENLTDSDADIVDVSGKYLFPGFIDAHTHMALEVCNTITADKFDTGTKAELAGGTTCIVDFATQYEGESFAQAMDNWHRKADGESSCDYAFHMAISQWDEERWEEIEKLAKEEVSSFKLYMTYDNRVDDETMYHILRRLKEVGAIAGVHCENHGIISARLKEQLVDKGGREDVSAYPGTRPEEAEAEAVSRLLKIAKCVDTPVIVVHLSTAAAYREVLKAREEGQTVYIETCPQYLVMDESRYSLPSDEARLYMCAPPLRRKENQKTLWEGLSEGKIDTVATDHCSFTPEQKEAGASDFAKTPGGMPGAQDRPALLWQFGVNSKKITPEQMCGYLSENPAKLYHLYPRKGVIAPGSDADIVVWNPDANWTIRADQSYSAAGYSPMEGTEINGRAEKVYLRGRLAAENGQILEEKLGVYIPHGTKVMSEA
ncbi:MAG: dihydropyrimidinase [Eubacteriales bacterium]|nr:dihydropyrimidinase [Eubacteriales bacterium]